MIKWQVTTKTWVWVEFILYAENSYVAVLSLYQWHPYKNRKFEHRHTHIHK